MSFLRRLWYTLTTSSQSQYSERPYPLCRFVYSRRQVNNTRVKAEAFLPYPGRETSVFQTRGLNSDDIWSLSRRARKDRDPKGRADFSESDLERPVNLRFVLDNTPPRHGNLKGWPAAKDEQKELALELAARATPLVIGSR